MATQAQILANNANAQHSTGPRTESGKARSSRNHLQHGLSLGFLTLTPEEKPEYNSFEAELRADIRPDGYMQKEMFQQLVESAWRLRRIRALVDQLAESCGDDPFVHPDTEAAVRQLCRYRAAAEMTLYRTVKTLRELQSHELFRALHLTKDEAEVIPPLANSGPKMSVTGQLLGLADRKMIYGMLGPDSLFRRFTPEAMRSVAEQSKHYIGRQQNAAAVPPGAVS